MQDRLKKGIQAQVDIFGEHMKDFYKSGPDEPQLTSQAAANMKLGNDKQFLISIISQCLPFIGYPRTLNALRCINEAAK